MDVNVKDEVDVEDGVAKVEVLLVPLRAIAKFWEAEKLQDDDSSEFMAL